MVLVNPGAANSESNPYKIETCEDFEQALTNRRYYRLENDLDFNEKGDSWFCEGYYTSSGTFIDLNGHTVKNIMMKNEATYFMNAYSSTTQATKIKNGKILNIFADGNTKFFLNCIFNNVSLSINATSCTQQIFQDSNFYCCSIYLKTHKLNKELSTGTYFENCYLNLEIDDINEKTLFGRSTVDSVDIQDCRITGAIKGKINIINGGMIKNSVINLNLENATDNGRPIFGQYPQSYINTGVINTSIISSNLSDYIPDSFLKADSAQIKNPVWLDENGFTVNKIETEPEDPSIT